jgi:hypothetical protein
MKKLVLVAAMAMFSVSYGAGRAAAQGPAGAGAGGGGAASGSSGSSITGKLNPIKWVKKDKSSDQPDAKAEQQQKLTANLQAQGVLSNNIDVKAACDNFKGLEDCVAALHASKNAGLDFNCLKSNVTGVQAGADMSTCKETGGDKGISLSKAIHLMKPDADAKGEAKNAEKQAKDDLKAAGA